MYIQSKVFTKLHVQAIDTIAGCHSIVLLIVLDSTINKRLVFFSSAVRSGIFTGVTEYGFCTSVHTIDVIAEEADRSLFAKMAGSQHCLHTLLPDIKPYSCRLRPKGHAYKLPECSRDLYKKSFVPRCLFGYS